MPTRPKSLCRKPGCVQAISSPGFCEKHVKSSDGWSQTNRASPSARGYDWKWRKTRGRILERDSGLCQLCLEQGLLIPASEVDHIVSRANGGNDDSDNLQAICRSCHKKKTNREKLNLEVGGYSNVRNFVSRPGGDPKKDGRRIR